MKNLGKQIDSVKVLFLFFIVYVYQTTLWLLLQKSKLFKIKELPSTPLYWIGGLRMGGSGKTAVTISLANKATKQGKHVAIIAYWINKRSFKKHMWVTSKTSWKKSSDEAMMLKQQTNCDVIVTRNRFYCWKMLSQKKCYDFILSDDGSVDFRLRPAFGIWICSPHEQIPKNLKEWRLFWPLGSARLSSSIIRPHHKVIYGPFYAPKLRNNQKFIRRLIFPHSFDFKQIYHIVTAIGNPQEFVNHLKSYHIQIKHTQFLLDHHSISPKTIQQIQHSAKESYKILMTSKDFIKLDATQTKYCIEIKEYILLPSCLTSTLSLT